MKVQAGFLCVIVALGGWTACSDDASGGGQPDVADTGSGDTSPDVIADSADDTGSATCTINFDSACPSETAVCGATFTGGQGCVTIGAFNCYESGSFSYLLADGDTVTVTLDDDANGVTVFFAAGEPGATGDMSFRDAAGAEVTSATTNGDCSAAMPPNQSLTFDTPVREVVITASGGIVWVDTLTLNP